MAIDPEVTALEALGCKLAVVTNKPEYLARKLLDELGMTARFECILGGDTLGPGRSKPRPDMVDDRAGHLAAVAKRPRTTTRGTILVRVYGDLAVLTGELSNQMDTPGQEPRAVRAYCHQVAVRAGGSWRFVSAQLTPLKVS